MRDDISTADAINDLRRVNRARASATDARISGLEDVLRATVDGLAALRDRVAALEPLSSKFVIVPTETLDKGQMGAIAVTAQEDPEGRLRMAQKFIAREMNRLADDLRGLTGDDDD